MENVSGDVGRVERQGRLLWILRAATALIDFMADDQVRPPHLFGTIRGKITRGVWHAASVSPALTLRVSLYVYA